MKEQKRRGARWLAMYTGMYACVAAALLVAMAVSGRSLIWEQDGSRQLYPALGYLGNMLRGLLRGQLPSMMSFSLGQGMDVMTSLAYYGYADPLCLLSAFFAGRTVETGYALIAFLRLYLTGAAAGLYMKRTGLRDDWAVACGAAIYAFDGFALTLTGMHPFFLNGPLFLPLMLIGVERILQDRRWLVFTLVTALMICANFYFAFMTTVVVILYILVRLIARLRSRGVKESAKDGFALLGAYLLGAALSAALFLPVVRVYLTNSRQGLDVGYSGSMYHYQDSYYTRMLLYFFAPWRSPGRYTMHNYAPLALFGLLALVGTRGSRARQVRVGILLCLAVVCVPLGGYLMNAGGYVSNRWSYAMGLFVAQGSAIGLVRLFRTRRLWRGIVAGLALACAALMARSFIGDGDWLLLIAPAMIAAFAALLLVWDAGRAPRWSAARMRMLALGFVGLGCMAYTLIGFLPAGFGSILANTRANVYDEIASMAAGQFVDVDDAHRVGQGRYDDAQSLMFDYHGTTFFWSLVDAFAPDYYRDLYLPTQTATCHIFGLGGGAAMNAVAAVKYVTQQADENWVIPYGFEKTGEVDLPNGTKAGVYENALALPIGYAFDRAMPVEEYDSLPVEDKLRALTAFAICDSDSLPEAEFVSAAREIPWTVSAMENVQMEDGLIDAEDGGTVELEFRAPDDCEVYLILDNLRINRKKVKNSQRGGLLVTSEQGQDEGNIPNPGSNFYFPKKGMAYCLGTGEMNGCTLTFEVSLSYRYNAIRVVAIPLSAYREDAAARRAEGMTDVKLGKDRITGKIAVSGDRVLQIAVPYSDGWRAWVDGEEKPVFRCGGMYMGLEIGAGSHEIEMRYATPGLKAGAIISLAAALAAVALSILGRRRRRMAQQSASGEDEG